MSLLDFFVGLILLSGVIFLVVAVITTIVHFAKQKKNDESLEKEKKDYLNEIAPGSIFKHVITFDNPFLEEESQYAIVVDIRENEKGVKYVKYQTLYKDSLNEGWLFGRIAYDKIETFVKFYDKETDLVYKDDKVIKSC